MNPDGSASDPSPSPQTTIDSLLPRQRQLWLKGERVRVEILLVQHPHLQKDRETVLDLINHEIVLRTEVGEPPTLEEYQQRFPEFRDDLVVLFEIHLAMEVHGDQTLSLKGSGPHTSPSAMPDLPNFTLEEILGEGGMGVVYKATDHRLKRTVALKMIRAGGGREERKRFQSEAEAVAKLDHPHIVHIFEVGEHERQPYFALEFVDGGSLTQMLKGSPQPPAFAAQMVETLARAVHYAHGQGIIHRDIKPGNILLHKFTLPAGMTATAGVACKDNIGFLPKVADFGLAKHIQPDSDASQTQAIVGTPSYMAPEQAGDFTHKIGPPADVYSLGAVLYEMITGRPPFRGASTMETLDQVRKLDPVAPTRLQPHCPRDLETICLKCLKKDPAARYASALELADDVGRFLRREPIRARPTGTVEYVWMWCRRNPRVATLSGSLLLVIAVSLGIVTWLWQRAARGEASAYAHLYASQINVGQRFWQEGQCGRLAGLLEKLRHPPDDQRDLRDFEWYYLNGLLNQDLKRWPGETCLAFSPDGKLLATAGPGNSLRLWSTESKHAREPLREWRAHDDAVTDVAFNPDGTLLLSGSSDRTARIWRVADGTLITTLDGHAKEVSSVAFDPSGQVIATASRDKTIRLWELDGTQRLILEEDARPINQVVFSPDGKMLASAGEDFKVRLWDVATGEIIYELKGHSAEVSSVAFAPDGLTLASGGWDKTVRHWDVSDGELLRTFPPLPHWVQRVAYRADGKRLAAACWDQSIHVWTLTDKLGRYPDPASVVLRGHIDRVTDCAFHPTKPLLASVARDRTIRLWDAELDPEVRQYPLDDFASKMVLHPSERTVAIVSRDALTLCDLQTGACRTLYSHKDPESHLVDAFFSNDGLWLACLQSNAKAFTCRVLDGATTYEIPSDLGNLTTLALDPKRQRAAMAGKDGTIRIRETANARISGGSQPFEAHRGRIVSLFFSSDGQWLYSAGEDKSLKTWNIGGSNEAYSVLNLGKTTSGLAISPDGTIVAIGGADAAVDLWDWRQKQKLRTLEGHSGTVRHLAFSHSGARLVTGGADGNLKLWDIATGQELLTLASRCHDVVGVAFDQKDETIIAVGNRRAPFFGQITIWDSRAGRKTTAGD